MGRDKGHSTADVIGYYVEVEKLLYQVLLGNIYCFSAVLSVDIVG
jgi:hypothetical protein